MDTPSVTATAKGPNQINLTWAAISNPGWGYLVEIQSDADSRYAAYTQLTATKNGRAWFPYWVTESHYTDITDGSGTSTGTAAQVQVYSIKYGTLYNFRVRCYAKTDAGADVYGSYSVVASATTTTPGTIRYVTVGGAGAQNGTSLANAWPAINSANGVAGGTLVLVSGGNYTSDFFNPSASGTQANRTVIQAAYGETPTITTHGAGAGTATVTLDTNYVILDGINVACNNTGAERVSMTGQRCALVGLTVDCLSLGYNQGVLIVSPYNLVHYCLLQRAGTASVDDGEPIAMLGTAADHNVLQYSNSQRGGHDTALVQNGSDYNQLKNNLFDGGWGLGWENVSAAGNPSCTFNLFEGNVVKDVGQNLIVQAYKPCVEISGQNTTFRRNILYNGRATAAVNAHGMELSALHAIPATGNLVYNNVFYVNGGMGVTLFGGNEGNNTIANNIIYGNKNTGNDYGDGAPLQTALADTFAGTVFNNNLILATPAGVETPGALSCHRDPAASQTTANANTLYAEWNNNVTTTPNMIDPVNAEFHLKSISGLRAVGVSITDAQWGTTSETDLGAFKWFDPTGASPSPPAAPTNLRLG